MKLFFSALLFCSIIAQSNRTAGCDLSVHGFDKKEFHSYFSKLQSTINNSDANEVASLFLYPFNSFKERKRKIIKNKKEFINNYKTLITPNIKDIIKRQKISELFCNYQGAMFGDGQLWIQQKKGKIGIGTINDFKR